MCTRNAINVTIAVRTFLRQQLWWKLQGLLPHALALRRSQRAPLHLQHQIKRLDPQLNRCSALRLLAHHWL